MSRWEEKRIFFALVDCKQLLRVVSRKCPAQFWRLGIILLQLLHRFLHFTLWISLSKKLGQNTSPTREWIALQLQSIFAKRTEPIKPSNNRQPQVQSECKMKNLRITSVLVTKGTWDPGETKMGTVIQIHQRFRNDAISHPTHGKGRWSELVIFYMLQSKLRRVQEIMS